MIIAVLLIRNEDIWLDRCLRSIREFCDEIIVIDNGSTDDTNAVVYRNRCGYLPVADLRKTHDILHPYIARPDTWIFGVDGDEIYDPAGLREVRRAILNHELNTSFQIAGRFLHVTAFGDGTVSGYMGPPAHAPVKLYNFAALLAWPSDHEHSIFHARTRELRPGMVERDTRYQRLPWMNCPLRCLHMRFTRRSSSEHMAEAGVRLSGEDRLGFGSRTDRGGTDARNERVSYRVGEIVEVKSWL